jgi:protein involved in polysaccharide export with SLBB domain
VPFKALIGQTLLGALMLALPAGTRAQNGPVAPGDRVLLRVFRDSLFTDTLRIDARGVAVVPFVGDVRLGGIAGDMVQDTLRSRLARVVDPMAVEAVLLRQVRVMGEVTRPGLYYLERTATARDAIAVAGGVTAIGHERRATLERAGERRQLVDWRLGPAGAVVLESGDALVVARLPWYRREFATIVTSVGVLASILIAVSR